MTTLECLQNYRNSVQTIETFISEAHKQDAAGDYIHTEAHRQFVMAAAIVRFSIAWEGFLENISCSYLMGEPDTEGNSVPCCLRARDEQHASKLLIGTNTYFDWTNPDKIVQLSTLYFNSDNPIKTGVLSVKSDLMDLKTIRNAAAHISASTQGTLNALASRYYGHQVTNAIVADVINYQIRDGRTVWQYFKDLLDVAAECIAKGQV